MARGSALRSQTLRRVSSRLIVTVTAMATVAGCTIAGPGAIRSGRLAYNEAIRETNNQQMLLVPVHNRYEESNHLLGVASVTANVNVSSSAQIEAGFGSSDNYEGNLVPFRGSFIYEENPTISYKPVSGEAYLQQLMSPISVSLLAQITKMPSDPEFVFGMLVASINGIRNHSFLYEEQQEDPRFDRFVSLMASLQRQHALQWVSESGEGLSLLIGSAAEREDIAELLSLLGIHDIAHNDWPLVLPVALSVDDSDNGGIGITTRSLWELIEILSSVVAIPSEHQSNGVAAEFPAPGRTGRQIAIRYSATQPKRAYVAVSFRDGWFYIDDSDLKTKRYFKIMGSLWSAAIAQSLGEGAAAPVLTVPVSR